MCEESLFHSFNPEHSREPPTICCWENSVSLLWTIDSGKLNVQVSSETFKASTPCIYISHSSTVFIGEDDAVTND